MITCKNGKHSWVEILDKKDSWDESTKVAKWCEECGSIVVDIEYDGRIDPGGAMKIRNPKVILELLGHKK